MSGTEYQTAYAALWRELGESRKMVLSTSLDNLVTSRMMSVVIMDGRLYFQTDRTLRKYGQLKGNANVALCADNVQIQGRCEEAGHPLENEAFCQAYRKHFPGSYEAYTALKNERLFVVAPTRIERWVYLDGVPHLEAFDVVNRRHSLTRYAGE